VDQVDFETDVVVVGAGVVGLAIAARLAERPSVLVVERHARFGRETSSRNSEVVHSGIYYPSNSLKTESCIEGRERLYAFCAKESVPHRKCGKIVVATTDDEVEFLGRLESHAPALNVPVRALDGQAVLAKEPFVRVHAGATVNRCGNSDQAAVAVCSLLTPMTANPSSNLLPA
jgi:L-2-hydroxyglutarate oxidase LhgO